MQTPVPGNVSKFADVGEGPHAHFCRSLAELDERERGEAGRAAGDKGTVGLVAVEESGLGRGRGGAVSISRGAADPLALGLSIGYSRS